MVEKSRLLVLLNRLKAEARVEWLTDSQLTAWAEIQLLWRFPERVNLYGPPGAGKTFLAWAVARATDAYYCASPRVYTSQAKKADRVVIDNVSDDVGTVRHLLAALQLNNTRTALLITAHVNRLGLAAVALPLPTARDIDVVYRNLSLLDHYAIVPKHAANLWEVVAEAL